MAYIEFRNVNKFYGENHVLKDICLSVEKGTLVTLLGPSGCGKSTLLRCLAGLETISSGQILVDGEDITNVPPQNRNIGMVFQHYSLFPNMTVAENVAFGLQMKKVPKQEIPEKVHSILKVVDLEGREDEYPENLSGGQQQRVALARAIVQEPKVLLLDEPLSAIDAKLRKALQQSIRDIQRKMKLTVIFVTHDQDEAMVMSDRISLFYNGQIEQDSTPVEMYTKPQTSFAATFIGNYNILSPEEFGKVTGMRNFADSGSEDAQAGKSIVAIRPETIRFMKEGVLRQDYMFEGTVTDSIPKGNVLQYIVDVNGVRLKVDVLFRGNVLFDRGTKVQMTLADENCIRL